MIIVEFPYGDGKLDLEIFDWLFDILPKNADGKEMFKLGSPPDRIYFDNPEDVVIFKLKFGL